MFHNIRWRTKQQSPISIFFLSEHLETNISIEFRMKNKVINSSKTEWNIGGIRGECSTFRLIHIRRAQ